MGRAAARGVLAEESLGRRESSGSAAFELPLSALGARALGADVGTKEDKRLCVEAGREDGLEETIPGLDIEATENSAAIDKVTK